MINYCSLQCRSSRNFTEESKIKKSESNKKFWRFLSTEERDKLISRNSKFHTEESLKKLRETYKNKLLKRDFNSLSFDARRKIVIIEQNNKCIKCNISEWLSTPLSLEIDHIDGNSSNNDRNNLEALCPNCHSITPTWRGRNRPNKNGNNRVSDIELLEMLKINKNIRQTLLVLGLAAKGNNYLRAKKLLTDIE